MNNTIFLSMKWTYKELWQLLLLVLVIVPIGIEFLLQDFLQRIFQNSLYSGTFTGFIMSIIFTLAVYVFALRPHLLGWGEVGICEFSRNYWKSIIGWTVVLIITSVFILILMDVFQVGAENSKTKALQENITWLHISIGFISAAVISPIYEEIFYRGFLYKWFRVKWGVGLGILLSSLIFTIVHIPTYNTLPINFMSGVILAWTYERSGSIIPGMIIHGLFNGLAVILTVLS